MSYVGFCPPGVILPYAGSTAPEGWLLCNGSSISQAKYPALFAAIGNTYNTQFNPSTNTQYTAPVAGEFRVPDYTASFLRGIGTPFAGDTVTLGGFQTHKTSANGLTATANSSAVTGNTNIAHSHSSSSVTGTTNTSGAHEHRVWTVGPSTDRLNWSTSEPPNIQGWGLGVSAGANTGDYNIFASSDTADGYNPNHSHGSSYTASGQTQGATTTALNSGSAVAQVIGVNSSDTETRPHNKGVNYIIKI